MEEEVEQDMDPDGQTETQYNCLGGGELLDRGQKSPNWIFL